MPLASELFAWCAIAVLLFGFGVRLVLPRNLSMTIHIRDTAYMFPPTSVCVWIATLLCVVASIYSLSMLPLNRTAALWHFWLTSVGLGLFWLSFYRLALMFSHYSEGTSPLRGLNAAAAWSQLISAALFVVGQLIFLGNLVRAVAKRA
jgi:hypothetical protein